MSVMVSEGSGLGVRRDEAGRPLGIDPWRADLDSGRFLLEAEDDVVVEIAPAARHRGDGDLLGEAGDGQGDVELPPELGGEGHVLAREGEGERRRVVVVAEDGPG